MTALLTTFALPPGTTARYGNFTVIALSEADYERIEEVRRVLMSRLARGRQR